jgi:hypothetical protein
MFEDLTKQAYEAKLIREPKLTSLAKFSLKFFAEMWLQQKAARERYEQKQLGSQRYLSKMLTGIYRPVLVEGDYIIGTSIIYIEDTKRRHI